ncbi:MCE family protein [Candidatus Saganbacteria bacterium]|nr:MCE family protein [Candidatus Saganbacteria bacterium]
MKLSAAAKVGIFTMVVFIALGLAISWKSNLFLIREGTELMGSFPNIEGLTIGSEVRYRGFTVGKVMKIDPGPQDIKIHTIIKKGLIVPENSTLRIGFDGIVGLKYLEIRPGTAEAAYKEGKALSGISTAGLVDFVDIGSQNLVETKKILLTLRSIIEDPNLQAAFKGAVFTADKVAADVERLTNELRQTNASILKITGDPNFQASVKGTVQETNRTLASANNFFDSFGKLNVKPSADMQYGTTANSVRGNLDIVQSPTDFLRVGIGEGPTRNLSLLDIQISRRLTSDMGMRLGMINTFLGGGLDFFASKAMIISGDLYDFNNPKPAVPKIRTTAFYKMYNYSDIFFQADDIFNSARNYSIGLRVKGVGD